MNPFPLVLTLYKCSYATLPNLNAAGLTLLLVLSILGGNSRLYGFICYWECQFNLVDVHIVCFSIQRKGLFKHLERQFIAAYLTLSKVHTTLQMLHTVVNNVRVKPLLEVGVHSLDDLRLRTWQTTSGVNAPLHYGGVIPTLLRVNSTSHRCYISILWVQSSNANVLNLFTVTIQVTLLVT